MRHFPKTGDYINFAYCLTGNKSDKAVPVMASASTCVESHKNISEKVMTNQAIDLDKSRLKLCIEILPESEQTEERLVIISICRDMGMPLIRTISLAELAPIPLPLVELVQAYAESILALPVQLEPDEQAKEPQQIAVTKRSLVSVKSEQMALL